MYIYIYIYIKGEREREREIIVYILCESRHLAFIEFGPPRSGDGQGAISTCDD